MSEGRVLAPTFEDVLAGRSRWSLERCNALARLLGMPDASVDAVITDMPYSSGGFTRGDRMAAPSTKYEQTGVKLARPDFAGDNRDQRSFGYWCALWLAEALRVAKPSSPICLFSDWRQLPTVTDAMQAGGWIWRGILPWDKTEGCRPSLGRFAAQCEYVAWGSAGEMPVDRGVGCLPGIVRAFPKPGEKNHLTGKTPKVMREVNAITAPGGVILDPFAGGCSGGVAAMRGGYRWIGFEIDEVNFGEGLAWMRAEENITTREGAITGQVSLFPSVR